ncbi:hypothetical protein AB0H17_27040 [Streptomyces olivoreticuli]
MNWRSAGMAAGSMPAPVLVSMVVLTGVFLVMLVDVGAGGGAELGFEFGAVAGAEDRMVQQVGGGLLDGGLPRGGERGAILE